MKMRLDKYLAEMGAGTRQEVKKYIRKGRVTVDGVTEKAPECKVDPQKACSAYNTLLPGRSGSVL